MSKSPRACALALLAALGWSQTASAQSKLWGWADLHAHPASHLSFGANAAGEDGIFWGKPGMSLRGAAESVGSDMPACAPDKHGGFDGDAVRHTTHQQVIGMLDNLTGFAHHADGAPSFGNWPHALSITHQQMHVTMLRRAYDGGQRLMIASVTDNEVLSKLWRDIGYNAAGNRVPGPSAEFDLASAKKQLEFIKRLAASNADWMEVAYSAADARRIVESNKLALILSVELDMLTAPQILQLVRDDGVRHVIPIHLVNNTLGGAAVYSDIFNASNAFQNSTRQLGNWNRMNMDGFFRVDYDTKLSARLSRPQTLEPDTGNLISGGAMYPTAISDAAFAGLGYDLPDDRGGHKNDLGLTDAALPLLRELARRGVLIDVVHMSEKAVGRTLDDFAKVDRYPVMNSHTGVRGPDETALNERAMMRAHALTISQLGGVIGVGTEGSQGSAKLLDPPTEGGRLLRFTGDFWTRSWAVARVAGDPVVTNLTVTLKTGADDLRGGNNRVWARVDIAGRIHEVDLSKGAAWPGGSTRVVTFPLPARTLASQLRSFGLRADPNAKNGPFDSPDNWDLNQLIVHATFARTDGVGIWAQGYLDVLSLMRGRGTAFGTDINGFAPQLPFASSAVTYPVDVAQRFGRRVAPALAKSALGPRSYDFQHDGIAHYGMLSDFVQALSTKTNGRRVASALFQSANDVVEMWERCESRAGHEGDYNGDGKLDVAVWRPVTRDWTVHLATGAGLLHQVWAGGAGSDGPISVGDFNADGRTDIVMWKEASRNWTVNLSNGAGFDVRTWTGGAGDEGALQQGDFNGDRRTDILVWRPATNDWRVNLSTGNGFTTQIWRGGAGSDGPSFVGDFNGDGKSDVVMSKQVDNTWTMNLSTGSGFTKQSWTGAWGSDGPISLGDFNADGKTDLVMWRALFGDWTVNLSTGTGFRWQAWRGASGEGPIRVGDFNGDRRSDVMVWRQASNEWSINLSTGSGFDSTRTCAGAWATDGPIHVGDFSGDGKTDVMMYRQSRNDWTVNIATDTGCRFAVW